MSRTKFFVTIEQRRKSFLQLIDSINTLSIEVEQIASQANELLGNFNARMQNLGECENSVAPKGTLGARQNANENR